MIYPIQGFNVKLEENNQIYSIYLYKRLTIKPSEKQIIDFPLRVWNPTRKYVSFELNKQLSLNGLQVLWHNLNEDSSLFNIEMLVLNNNLDYDLLYRTENPLYLITGSKNKIDLVPETFLGRIFLN